MTRKKKITKSPALTGYILITGNATYVCRTRKKRTALIRRLGDEGLLKPDYKIRTV